MSRYKRSTLDEKLDKERIERLMEGLRNRPDEINKYQGFTDEFLGKESEFNPMTKCNCHSYNADIGTVPEVILDPRKYFPECTKTVCVDACIAKEIEMLWENGVWTCGCCCGHNGFFHDKPNVVIDEGQDPVKTNKLLSEFDKKRKWDVYQWQLINTSEPERQ